MTDQKRQGEPTIHDAMPAMADVISGSIPRPTRLKPGADVARWARKSASILSLADRWGVAAATVQPAPGADDDDLADAMGDFGAWVTFGGRLVALNCDGTRCAWRQDGTRGT